MNDLLLQQDGSGRWRFLVGNPAVKSPGWLPPAAEVPELADLRDEHARLRALEAETMAEWMALQAQRDRDEEARRAAQEAEFLGKGPAGELPPITVADEDIFDAKVRAEAAMDAFQSFVRDAIGQVREREGALREGLIKIEAEAETKEEEARTIMAEANRLKANTLRLKAWLERTTSKGPLGLVAWSALPAPVPAEPMTLAELHAAAVPAWGAVDLETPGIPHSLSFGTDDPEDLDNDSTAVRPWEVALND